MIRKYFKGPFRTIAFSKIHGFLFARNLSYTSKVSFFSLNFYHPVNGNASLIYDVKKPYLALFYCHTIYPKELNFAWRKFLTFKHHTIAASLVCCKIQYNGNSEYSLYFMYIANFMKIVSGSRNFGAKEPYWDYNSKSPHSIKNEESSMQLITLEE